MNLNCYLIIFDSDVPFEKINLNLAIRISITNLEIFHPFHLRPAAKSGVSHEKNQYLRTLNIVPA